MVDSISVDIANLRRDLRGRVSKFCVENKALWKDPIIKTFNEIRDKKWEAVIFGGTLRSLMLGSGESRRPRDIDIVLSSVTVDDITNVFSESFMRKTRFGGVKLQQKDMEFDLWPIDRTWSFVTDESSDRTNENLPKTTFLDIEAIAIDIWPKAEGQKRAIYSDNDSFFRAILKETIEINREENPFPILCVVRSLIMAANLRFKMGEHLSEYIERYGSVASFEELESVQKKHYGRVKIQGKTLLDWITYIKKERQEGSKTTSLPLAYKQLEMWETNVSHRNSKIHIYYDKW